MEFGERRACVRSFSAARVRSRAPRKPVRLFPAQHTPPFCGPVSAHALQGFVCVPEAVAGRMCARSSVRSGE